MSLGVPLTRMTDFCLHLIQRMSEQESTQKTIAILSVGTKLVIEINIIQYHRPLVDLISCRNS